MATITKEQIIEMNELYLKLKTYAGVSRAMGGRPSPTTVKKYIIPNYVSQENLNIVKFKKEDVTSSPDARLSNTNNWDNLCELSNEEVDEIKLLWKELII